MGLDILAYSKLVEEQSLSANELRLIELGLHEPGETVVQVDRSCLECQGLAPGRWQTSSASESLGFRAGSYSGYNAWRRALSRMALGCLPEAVWCDLERWRGAPFFELINHSDCDGAIGGQPAQKLFRDFVEWRDRARAWTETEGFFEVYEDFLRAFRLAADEGAVIFC